MLCLKPNDTESREWQTTCMDGQCVGQDDVKLSVKSRLGIAMLRKRLLNVTYLPERKSPLQGRHTYRPVLPSQLLIECGHANFRSLQRYPDVLCGKCAVRVWSRQLSVSRRYPDVLCGKCAVRVWPRQLPVSQRYSDVLCFLSKTSHRSAQQPEKS